MAFKFLPAEMLRKIAPKSTVKKLVSSKLTVNRAAVTMLEKSGVLSKKKLETIALKVIKGYKERYAEAKNEGATNVEAFSEATNGKALIVARVQNAVVYEIAQDIKDQYHGEFYEWLPSDAETPDPIHQLNYGKRFQMGKGEMPGDRYGCRCGMNVLVSESTLSL
jgi:hypothetical protein